MIAAIGGCNDLDRVLAELKVGGDDPRDLECAVSVGGARS